MSKKKRGQNPEPQRVYHQIDVYVEKVDTFHNHPHSHKGLERIKDDIAKLSSLINDARVSVTSPIVVAEYLARAYELLENRKINESKACLHQTVRVVGEDHEVSRTIKGILSQM